MCTVCANTHRTSKKCRNSRIGMSHSIISSPEALTNPIPRTSIITYITMVRPVDQAKLKKLISFIRLVPHLSLPDAMKMAKYSDNEISDRSLQRVLLRHLPGHSLVAFREILAGKGAPPRNHDERLKKQRKQGAIERTPPPERTPPLSIKPHCRSSLLLVDVKRWCSPRPIFLPKTIASIVTMMPPQPHRQRQEKRYTIVPPTSKK